MPQRFWPLRHLPVLFAFPLSAQAMEVERWTAQPNDDALEKVMGATPTRVTWQGQTAEDESLSALAIDLPEGSSVDAENVKVTVMTASIASTSPRGAG